MQKHNKNKKDFLRGHHIRIGAVAIAVATGFHLSGSTHMGGKIEHHLGVGSGKHPFNQVMERENETARHMMRFDEGLRLPSTTGSNA